MTINQAIHHQEQMEALRRDFQTEFEPTRIKLSKRFALKHIMAVEHEAWNKFKEAHQSNNSK